MTIVIKTHHIYVFVVMYNLSGQRVPCAAVWDVSAMCVFNYISLKIWPNNYISWLLFLNRGAAFCRISRILVKLHCWALLREFVTACWGELTGRVKFTPQILLGVQMWPLFSILHTLSLDIHKLHIRLNEWLNLLGARGFWKKCWILTSRFQNLWLERA